MTGTDGTTSFERPASYLLALEMPRAAADFVTLGPAWPLLQASPPGDGHPVLVLPGFGASDISTRPLRAFLRTRDYHVHAWRLGRNLGPTPGTIAGLEERVRYLADQHSGRTISIVGWSLGGIYAREIARAAPGAVRQVITLGSPFRLRDRSQTNVGYAFGTATRGRAPRVRSHIATPEEARGPLPVPATAIYSRTDGVVPWRACLELPSRCSESIEVGGSHVGLGHNPAVLWIVADRLAQREGQWEPFRARGVGRLLMMRTRSTRASAA